MNIFFRYGKKLLEVRLADQQLNMQDLIVLLVIYEAPGILQSKLNRFTCLNKGNFSKLLKKLEADDLIYRRESEEFPGHNQCYLTDAGQSLCPKLQDLLAQWEAAVVSDISQADLLTFNETAEKISDNLCHQLDIKW